MSTNPTAAASQIQPAIPLPQRADALLKAGDGWFRVIEDTKAEPLAATVRTLDNGPPGRRKPSPPTKGERSLVPRSCERRSPWKNTRNTLRRRTGSAGSTTPPMYSLSPSQPPWPPSGGCWPGKTHASGTRGIFSTGCSGRWLLRLANTPASHAAPLTPPQPKGGEGEKGPAGSPDGSGQQYVTLDQMAAWVNRSKRTLEKLALRKGNPLPDPDIQGGGGKPNEWKWERVRGWLEKEYGRNLPVVFPTLTETDRS